MNQEEHIEPLSKTITRFIFEGFLMLIATGIAFVLAGKIQTSFILPYFFNVTV